MDIAEIEDAFHRLDGDFYAHTELALAADPNARLHVLRAGAARLFALPVDPSAELAAAERLPRAPVDDSLLTAIRTLLEVGPGAATDQFNGHTEAFPDDLVGAFFRTMTLLLSARPGRRDLAMALIEQDAERHGDDWRVSSSLAMVRQEQRRHDEARALAENALEQEPRAGHAVHVLAHVHYETGEHRAGLAWLDEWCRDHTVAVYQAHFVWHTTLHALALGEVDEALDRYRSGIGPASPVDAGTLLWRCRLAGTSVTDLGREAVRAAQPLLDVLPVPFPVFNVCFALAAAEDRAGLAALIVRLKADPRPGFADLVAPVAEALLAMVDDRPDDGVRFLQPLLDDLPRVGGSNAQREVVEDTLLAAYLMAGRGDEARVVLERRLARRPHALDRRLLDRAGPG